jgi:6-phosphofructokinase 1
VVVVGEGLKGPDGNEIGADSSKRDAFGHVVLSGAADRLKDIVEKNLAIKARTVKLGYAQRAAAHFASAADIEEAHACGAAAVRAAVEGKSGFMVKIVRISDNPYQWKTDLQDLKDIANVEHMIPRDWISEDGFLPNDRFIQYARPLIAGEVKPPIVDGLPQYVRLDFIPVEKVLGPR